MTPSRTYLDFLEDIRSAARKAQAFVTGMSYEAFVTDEKTAFAVVRALEIIGEAAKRIPQDVRDKGPEPVAVDVGDSRQVNPRLHQCELGDCVENRHGRLAGVGPAD